MLQDLSSYSHFLCLEADNEFDAQFVRFVLLLGHSGRVVSHIRTVFRLVFNQYLNEVKNSFQLKQVSLRFDYKFGNLWKLVLVIYFEQEEVD